MDYRADWTYKNLPQDRVEHLNQCPPYNQIISQIATKMKRANIEFQIDPGRYVPVDGAFRPLFYVDVGENLADWFFNGVCGYRAQYYKSPEKGLQANCYAFAKLEKLLFSNANSANFCYEHPDQGKVKMNEDAVLVSLRLPSAKIWSDEHGGELKKIVSENQNIEPQIVAPRWADNAVAGEQKASKGIKAPKISTLKFHGAFLKDGEEVIPLEKMSRSEDIFFWGFS